MPPACLRSAKMRLSRLVTSRVISAWIASAVFFLRGQRILHRPGAADLFIDLDEGALQLPVTAERLDLAFGLALLGRCGEALGNGPAIHLVGQSRMRPVTWIAWTMTMTTRITTATTCSRDRPGTKIFQIRNLPQDCGPLLFQLGERFGHGHLSITERIIYARLGGSKKETCPILTFMSRARPITVPKERASGGAKLV